MATIKRFEDLDCWKISLELCNKVGELIDSGSFEKHFRLIGQIEGSSGSIMDNIAVPITIGMKEAQGQNLYNSLDIQKVHVGSLGLNYTEHWAENISLKNNLMNYIILQ